MAKIASKGTKLQLSIATVFTDIVAINEIGAPDAEVQTYDATCLDSGVGMENKPTGYVQGGDVSFSGLFDPVAATHQACTDLITAPAVASWKIIWSDAAPTAWPFSGVLTKLTPKAAVNDGLKFDGAIKLDGIVSYPT